MKNNVINIQNPVFTSEPSEKRSSNIQVLRQKNNKKDAVLKIAVIPATLDFYDTQCPDLRGKLGKIAEDFSNDLKTKNLDIIKNPMVVNDTQMKKACRNSINLGIDLLVIVHMSYSPSGQLAPAILDSDVPVVLYPCQVLPELIAKEYDIDAIDLNHGVHGTMDLANVLHRNRRSYGLLHGYWKDNEFRNKLCHFAQAGRLIREMKTSNPIILCGRFEKMLDLQLDNELFIKDFGVEPSKVSEDDFVRFYDELNSDSVNHKIEEYRNKFALAKDVTEKLLSKTARNELALRRLLVKFNSKAIGINFMNSCSHHKIADALHVPANMLMAEGVGYAAEGDWETAMFMRGLQAACGIDQVSFTEIFFAGYRDNRFVLRHWGEGNIAIARKKPILATSKFKNASREIDFLVNKFSFTAGPATLINLNATDDSNGQIISMFGSIEEEELPPNPGVGAIFKPKTNDIAQLLTSYSRLGGSHHMVVVRGECRQLLESLAILTGWKHYEL